MRVVLPALLALACAVGTATAQDKKPPKTVALSGCVLNDEKTPDLFTLTDQKTSRSYRLTGANLREYVGKLVQINGSVVVKGIQISGGLQPSANVAAQAGAMDPSRAAVAAASGIGPTGSIELSEFRIKTVHPSGGACP
jgi:hypothetical protein